MRRKIIAVTWIFCMLAMSLSAVIIKVSNLEPIAQILDQLDERALVLFDVDETLLIPQDAILQPGAQETLKRCIAKFIENPKSLALKNYTENYLMSLVLAKTKFRLIDLRSVDLIHQLQERGIRTIALTATRTGSLGTIPSMEDWRILHLKELGIDFSVAFSEYPYFALPPLDGACPVFKQGVLFADTLSKGETLIAFLEQVQWRPCRVIFIDNDRRFLNSVAMALKNSGINFVGFHYTEAKSYPKALDIKLAEVQFQHLAEKREWLNDEEAKLVLDRLNQPKDEPKDELEDEPKDESEDELEDEPKDESEDEPAPCVSEA